ncbi:MAG: ferritin family protein [Syntrophotaleaceae bacterium]
MNIFEFALQMEKEAVEFYTHLARQVSDRGPKQIFIDLAMDHVQRRQFIEKVKVSSQWKDLNDHGVTCGPWHKGVRLNGEIDDEAAYRLALEWEEAEMHCFEDLLERARARGIRKALERIAEEEDRRVARLRQIYDFINAPNQYLAWGEFSNLEEFHQFGRDIG